MIVVADTSPLNYLMIDEIELLPAIFGDVLIPQSVLLELMHPRASSKVRQWSVHLPAWADVRAAINAPNASLQGLDIGEREAIQLALDLGIGTVLLDETDGRHRAESLHLEVRGTLGVLERAARLGKIDFRTALGRLEQTNFRVSAAVKQAFLARNP